MKRRFWFHRWSVKMPYTNERHYFTREKSAEQFANMVYLFSGGLVLVKPRRLEP